MPLAKIGQHDVRAWVAELGARDLAASTVQRAYQLLSKVMAAAVDAGMIPRTPCRAPVLRDQGRIGGPGTARPISAVDLLCRWSLRGLLGERVRKPAWPARRPATPLGVHPAGQVARLIRSL
jgi:hypothetical protein